jgi:Rod binding domain-containing protein
LTPYVNPVNNIQPSITALAQYGSNSFSTDSQLAAQTLMGNTLMSHVPSLSNPSKLNSLRPIFDLNSSHIHSDAQLRKVSKDFETIFLQMMLKEMRNSVQKSGLMGDSQATDMFESMQDEQISKQLASAGGIGIGSMIYGQLQKAVAPHQISFK